MDGQGKGLLRIEDMDYRAYSDLPSAPSIRTLQGK
jgi:hypothetical protein